MRFSRQITPMPVDRRGLHAVVLAALTTEMDKRPHDATLDWIANERHAMVEAANRWTERFDMGAPITVEQVEAIEHRAVGYCDYASKMALYVAELALGLGQ